MRHRWATAVLASFVLLLAALPLAAQQRDQVYSARANSVPEGTHFIVQLDNKLEAKKLKRGKKFKAKLSEDLYAADGTFIPRGKKLKGIVSNSDDGHLMLTFTEIDTRKGWVPLSATITDVPGDKGVKTKGNEGEIERKGSGTKRAVTTAAIGAGIGALGGAVAGGTKGAVIGAAAGAGVGLGAALLTNRELVLEKGQQLELRLDRPLTIPVR